MERASINPWSWSGRLGFDQAQLVEGHRRELICSGQDAVDADGNPQHPGNMAAQLGLALANVVRLNAYTTDVDELFKHWASLTDRFGKAGGRFVTSVLGVAQLAAPPLLVLLEATAVE
jgi:enamine deaminase RidA (YjgF/YER057c/UK114 family)